MKLPLAIGLYITASFLGLAVGLLYGGVEHRGVALLSFGIVAPTGLFTILMLAKLQERWPEYVPPAIILATGGRMLWAVGCVFSLGPKSSAWGTTQELLGYWTTGFYVLTLTLESGLCWWVLQAATRAK